MPVTITRTAWIDDDGTGTTGTVLNNAVKTDLYNQIDGALAKVAQLVGDNVYAGTQFVTGGVAVTGPASVGGDMLIGTTSTTVPGKVHIAADGVIRYGISIQNTNPSNSINYLLFLNSAAAAAGNIAQNGATAVVYGTTSDARLKADAGPASDLAALRAIVVHDFTWKADGVADRGIFAQEAAALFPRAILAGTDETTEAGHLARPWMADYSKFVADLIVGWQQHDAALDALRARLDAISTVRADRP